MDLVIASKNAGKIREIREVLDLPGLTLLTFEDLGGWPDPEETGQTLEQNAAIKAAELRERFSHAALADDSGLEVDYLGGRPGIHSSRYAGPEGDSDRNIEKLLAELEGVKPADRTARFRCVVALSLEGDTRLSRGVCEGTILDARRGEGGFGYDPVFEPAGFRRTMAELSLEEKNEISHRGKALRAMRAILGTYAK
jgi:XTP/dITP diphosphohydrolase